MIYKDSRTGGSIAGEDVDVIEEKGLVPYREQSRSMVSRSPFRKFVDDGKTISDAEYRDVTDDDSDGIGSESLSIEQVSRMSESEIEKYKNARAKYFETETRSSPSKARKMADAEVDSIVEDAKQEQKLKDIQTARDIEWDKKSREIKKEKIPEEIQPTYEEPKSEKITETYEFKPPEEKIKEATKEPSLYERVFGKRKEEKEVPLSPKEIKMLRIQKSKEEYLRKTAELREKLNERKIGRIRGERGISLRDVGKGDMSAKEFGYREPSSTDFFGTKEFMTGTRPPIEKEKIIKSGLSSTKLRPVGTKPPSTKLRPVGINPPSTSFGGGNIDIESMVNVGFGISKQPVTLKDKLGKPKIVKPKEFSFGFSNTIPDINESLSLGKYISKKQTSTPSKVKPTVVKPKNSIGDWGINGKIKNPMEDWESNKKEKLNNKKSKKESLDFLKI